jgi:hypothetical protein
MTWMALRRFALTIPLALLWACGGKSGSLGPTFNLAAAQEQAYTQTGTQNFVMSGTLSGLVIQGSGTWTSGAVTTGTFEGQSANQKTSTYTGNYFINGAGQTLSSQWVSWTDVNHLALGESTAIEYVVVNHASAYPSSAHVGDSGLVFTGDIYDSSAKSTWLGTVTASYLVESDSAQGAWVSFIQTYRATSNAIIKTKTSRYRFTASNAFTRIQDTVVDYTIDLNTSFTY